MKAVILVGGEGTRLRPLTVNAPKPMIPVLNRPFLEHVLDYLRGHGIDDVVLSMGYRSDVITKHFGDGRDFGVNLVYVHEDTPLGTAGAVKNAEQYLDGTCFVFNGDILTSLDLGAMLEYHRKRQARVTISLTPVEDPTAYGLVELDDERRVLRFIEKPTWDRVTTNLINAGTYIVEPEVFRYVPPHQYYMFEHGLFPVLLQTGDAMYGYPSSDYWIDIGTPAKYLGLHRDLLTGRANATLPGRKLREGIWVDDGCQIDPTARLVSPVVLGRNVVVGPNATLTGPVVMGSGSRVGRDSVIEDAVIWSDSVIGNSVTMKTCVVGSGSRIGDHCWITNGAILGDNCIIGANNKLEHAIRIWPGKTIESGAITF
ncbi:MAG: sugar phosphate nucleotidyltransferase [Chloroflexota bacterium]